jgi:hypothetical protein
MQTLIDPFELSYSSTYSSSAFPRPSEQSGPRLIPPGDLNARATLLDVDEIFWSADDDEYEEEKTLDLDLDEALPRPQVAPRGRGARVWTSED